MAHPSFMNKIPRRASRNLWQRLKRWWRRRSGAVIYFDKAAKRGVMIAYRYPEDERIK